MHKLSPQIESVIDIPLLHIADAVSLEIKAHGYTKIGLLGTSFTMEQGFYTQRIQQQLDVAVITPNQIQRQQVNDIIFHELCRGQFKPESKTAYLNIIEDLNNEGAQAIILACTEIGLLIQQSDSELPLIDATQSHINQAVYWALN